MEENNGHPVYPFKVVSADKNRFLSKSILAKCKLIGLIYMTIAEVVDYQNKKFIVLWCPGGDSRPYSSPKTMAKDNKERTHYIRKMSNTVEPSDDEEKDLFNYPFAAIEEALSMQYIAVPIFPMRFLIRLSNRRKFSPIAREPSPIVVSIRTWNMSCWCRQIITAMLTEI